MDDSNNMHIKLEKKNQYFLECSTGGYLHIETMNDDTIPPDSLLDKVFPVVNTRIYRSESSCECLFLSGEKLTVNMLRWTAYVTSGCVDYSEYYHYHHLWLKLIQLGLYPENESDPMQIALRAWNKRRLAIKEINAEFTKAMTAIGGQKQNHDGETWWEIPSYFLVFYQD